MMSSQQYGPSFPPFRDQLLSQREHASNGAVQILRKTNFATGLYSEQQLDRKWDGYDKEKVGKDANQNRRKFLSDILAVVNHSLDEEIHCDIKEVLRGKHAEGANKLLQHLAKAAYILQLDGSEAVQMLKRKEDGHADLEAQRPESRRAPKPARVTEPKFLDVPGVQKPERVISIETVCTTRSEGIESQTNEESVVHKAASIHGGSLLSPKNHAGAGQSGLSNFACESASVASAPPLQTAEAQLASNSDAVTDVTPRSRPSHTRPLTAKKAPPPAAPQVQVNQRTRLRPPQASAVVNARHGVHVYREEHDGDEESIDVVETGHSVQPEHSILAHGVLVNEINKAKEIAEALQQTQHHGAEVLLDGINLGRSKRSKHRTGRQVDLGFIQQAVEKLVQQITPLAKAMEYLQEDKENMHKELQIWRSEARTWGEQLAEEVQSDGALDNAPLVAMNEQIHKRKVSIKQLQRKIVVNNEKIAGMLNLVIGDK